MRRADIYASSNPTGKPSYKGKFHEKIKHDRAAQKQESALEQERKAALLDKKLNYGKFVKDEYLPPRNSRKIQEMDDLKQKLQGHNQRKMPFRDDLGGEVPHGI